MKIAEFRHYYAVHRQYPKLQMLCIALAIALAVFSAGAQSAPAGKAISKSEKKAASATHAAVPEDQDPGERKFQANCSRCHNAPDQLSPRISGTVVRHMRIRAILSAQDERDILRYLAP